MANHCPYPEESPAHPERLTCHLCGSHGYIAAQSYTPPHGTHINLHCGACMLYVAEYGPDGRLDAWWDEDSGWQVPNESTTFGGRRPKPQVVEPAGDPKATHLSRYTGKYVPNYSRTERQEGESTLFWFRRVLMEDR